MRGAAVTRLHRRTDGRTNGRTVQSGTAFDRLDDHPLPAFVHSLLNGFTGRIGL